MRWDCHRNFRGNFTWFCVCFSDLLDWIVVTQAWYEINLSSPPSTPTPPPPPAQVTWQICPWPLKTDKVTSDARDSTGGYWRFVGGGGANVLGSFVLCELGTFVRLSPSNCYWSICTYLFYPRRSHWTIDRLLTKLWIRKTVLQFLLQSAHTR